MSERLFLDTEGPTWVGQAAQMTDAPVYVDPETGQNVYPGYTYDDDPEVQRVGPFDQMPTIPRSTHPVLGGQNTRESMIAEGKTHSETYFDPATGIVTEIWDNEVQEGEIRNQTLSGSTIPGEVKALARFRGCQGYDHHTPIVRPSSYRKEDPIPDGYNTEAAYWELARQRAMNAIRTDNAIANDYRPPQIRESAGVIDPFVHIRPYAPNTSRNLMNRRVMGHHDVHVDATVEQHPSGILTDRQTQEISVGAGLGGAEEVEPRRFESMGGFIDEDQGMLYGGSAAPLLPPTSGATRVESVGITSIGVHAPALGGGEEGGRPEHGRITRRPIDNTVTDVTQVALHDATGDAVLPPRGASLDVATRPLDMEYTNVSNRIEGQNDPIGTQDRARAVHIPGALNRQEITFGRIAPSTPQWDSHGVQHGRLTRRPNEIVREHMHSRGVGNLPGDAIGEITRIRPSQGTRNHNIRGQFVESATESDDVGRVMAFTTLRDQSTTARQRQPSTMAL